MTINQFFIHVKFSHVRFCLIVRWTFGDDRRKIRLIRVDEGTVPGARQQGRSLFAAVRRPICKSVERRLGGDSRSHRERSRTWITRTTIKVTRFQRGRVRVYGFVREFPIDRKKRKDANSERISRSRKVHLSSTQLLENVTDTSRLLSLKNNKKILRKYAL